MCRGGVPESLSLKTPKNMHIRLFFSDSSETFEWSLFYFSLCSLGPKETYNEDYCFYGCRYVTKENRAALIQLSTSVTTHITISTMSQVCSFYQTNDVDPGTHVQTVSFASDTDVGRVGLRQQSRLLKVTWTFFNMGPWATFKRKVLFTGFLWILVHLSTIYWGKQLLSTIY